MQEAPTCLLLAPILCSALPLPLPLPPCSKLTEVQNDVQEVLDAIGDVVNDDAEARCWLCCCPCCGRCCGGCGGDRCHRCRAYTFSLREQRQPTLDPTCTLAPAHPPQVKKLCLTERQVRAAAAAAAAKAGEARIPPELASSGGRTPEMRMGAAILESYEFKLQGTHVSGVLLQGCGAAPA